MFNQMLQFTQGAAFLRMAPALLSGLPKDKTLTTVSTCHLAMLQEPEQVAGVIDEAVGKAVVK